MFFRRGRKQGAVVEQRPEVVEAAAMADEGRHSEAIESLTVANRAGRDPELEREIRRIRHLAGLELLANPATDPTFPEPAPELEAGDPVRILSSAFPGWAPAGSAGTVNDVFRGVVYVRMAESAHVIPFDRKDIELLCPAVRLGVQRAGNPNALRRLCNLSDQVAR